MWMTQSISPSESTSRWSITSSVPQTPSAAVTSSTHSISPAVTSQPTVTSQPHSQSSLTSEQNVTATTKPAKATSGNNHEKSNHGKSNVVLWMLNTLVYKNSINVLMNWPLLMKYNLIRIFPLPVTEGSTEGPKLGQTEWMLIACLGAFAIVLITLVILVIQMSRLNQTVTRLKDASHRWVTWNNGT